MNEYKCERCLRTWEFESKDGIVRTRMIATMGLYAGHLIEISLQEKVIGELKTCCPHCASYDFTHN